VSLATRLYSGDTAFDFTGHRRRWYVISGVILVVSVAALLVRGLNLGIDFKGGATYEFPRHGHSVADAKTTAVRAGEVDPVVQGLGSDRVRITTPTEDSTRVNALSAAIQRDFGIPETQVSVSTVGPTWGSEISKKALEGLGVFLVLVVLFLAVRFEPKMAAAAIVALLHDLLITIGVYALVGFEVTPSTVIAVLTILGFSLYDTVVVFDRVRELTVGLQSNGRRTYSQAANRALNQTLVRSINTSFIALVPVAALLFVGAGLLGAGTLKDLALAQLIGLAAGAYSSIFIATPLLAQLKEREPGMVALAAKVARAEASGKTVGTGRRPVTGVVTGPVTGAPSTYGVPNAPTTDAPAGDLSAVLPPGPVPVGTSASAAGARRVQSGRPQQRRGGKRGRPSGKRR